MKLLSERNPCGEHRIIWTISICHVTSGFNIWFLATQHKQWDVSCFQQQQQQQWSTTTWCVTSGLGSSPGCSIQKKKVQE